MRGASRFPSDARPVLNHAHGGHARAAGRFPLLGNYTTTIQRPTVLGWAFSFAAFVHHAGFQSILRVPATPGMGDLARPVRPCSALSSLETCASFFAVAHADGIVRQPPVRVPMGMV